MSNAFPEISVTLQSVVCNGASEGSDGIRSDDIYVIWQADGGVPHRYPAATLATQPMQDGDTWNINQVMTFSRDLQVTIYDQDAARMPTFSDYLVSWGFTNIDIAPSSTMSNYNGASYTIRMAVNA